MEARDKDPMILRKKSFHGSVARGAQTFPVDFQASAGPDSRLRIDIDPLPTETLCHLQKVMGEPGSRVENLILVGQSVDGASFSSDRLQVRGAKFGSENRITVSPLRAKVVIPRDEPAQLPMMQLWLRSFKSFVNPIVQTSLGKLKVWGNEKKVSIDEISGNIAVQADNDTDMTDWEARVDEFLTYMHRGLAFANGSRLQAPRLDVVTKHRWEATFYEGKAFGPSLPPIPHLHQGPFIKALVERYEKSKPFPEMLWTAVGWLQNDAITDEALFLVSMTALETVVEHVIPRGLTTVVAKSDFISIRGKLLEVIEQATLPSTERDIFLGKIRSLNGRALSQKIEALRDHYGLEVGMFSSSEIRSIIDLRNTIVHTGTSVATTDFWPKIIFVRELISRIMFHELDYIGPYESYLGGYKLVYPDQHASDG